MVSIELITSGTTVIRYDRLWYLSLVSIVKLQIFGISIENVKVFYLVCLTRLYQGMVRYFMVVY